MVPWDFNLIAKPLHTKKINPRKTTNTSCIEVQNKEKPSGVGVDKDSFWIIQDGKKPAPPKSQPHLKKIHWFGVWRLMAGSQAGKNNHLRKFNPETFHNCQLNLLRENTTFYRKPFWQYIWGLLGWTDLGGSSNGCILEWLVTNFLNIFEKIENKKTILQTHGGHRTPFYLYLLGFWLAEGRERFLTLF